MTHVGNGNNRRNHADDAFCDGIQLRRLPKTDLHRHLSGAIRFTTLFELCRAAGVPVGARDPRQLEARMAVHSPVASLRAFVSPDFTQRPWDVLPRVITGPEIAARIAFEAVEDAWFDGVRYVELRISPYGILTHTASHISLYDFLEGLKSGLAMARQKYQAIGTIILSLTRHHLSEIPQAERSRYYTSLLSTALEFLGDPVVGFDLTGVERSAPPHLFAEFFTEVKTLGFGVTIHAGEGEPSENIRSAIEDLHADRIGHGISLWRDPALIDLVISRNVVIEQCLTANVMTGIAELIEMHPLTRLLRAGVKVVLCTDNPMLFGISLTDEYVLALNHLDICYDDLVTMNQWARSAAFTATV